VAALVCALIYYGWPLIQQVTEAVTPDEKGVVGGLIASCTSYLNQFFDCFRDLANGLTGNDQAPVLMDGYTNFTKAPESILDDDNSDDDVGAH
jgi:hypothetical protein